MKVRSELPADQRAISAVITAAFLKAEHSGGNEANIVETLRNTGSLTVSLVAMENERIVGHVAFSPVTVEGRGDGWFGLGPVAVMPSRQGNGIGTALIQAGFERLRARGAKGCVVLGDPAYYRRFGFTADSSLWLDGVAPEYFQRVMFTEERCVGEVAYHPAFQAS